MSPTDHSNQTTPGSPSKEGSSALEREAKRVEDITQSKDRDREDHKAALAKSEAAQRVEQDVNVEKTRQQARQDGSGSNERADELNRDG